jgi:hypothetical protein
MAYFVAIHEIADPGRFWGGDLQLRPGMALHDIFPRGDASKAVCLWEADSADSIHQVLDDGVGDASRNEIFEVDTEHPAAQGLPTSAATDA